MSINVKQIYHVNVYVRALVLTVESTKKAEQKRQLVEKITT